MSKNIFDQYETNKELETKGVVLDYGTDRVTVRPAGGTNKRYVSVLDKQAKDHKRAMSLDVLDHNIGLRILYITYSLAVVIGWETCVSGEELSDDGVDTRKWTKGITNPDGDKPTPFTPENVVKTFTRLPRLFLDMKEECESVQLFQAQSKEADAKNLSGS